MPDCSIKIRGKVYAFCHKFLTGLTKFRLNRGKNKSGCSAKFFPINRDVGFKIYGNYESACQHHKNATAGFEAGIAPALSEEIIKIEVSRESTQYGFLVERGEELMPRLAVKMLAKNSSMQDIWDAYCSDSKQLLKKYFSSYASLEQKAKRHNIQLYDTHFGNLAIFKGRGLLFVDMGT